MMRDTANDENPLGREPGLVTALRAQGASFAALALCVAIAGAGASPTTTGAQLVVLTIVITILGVPHGALDAVFARHQYGIASLWGWARFTVAYVALAALVVALWRFAPAVFFVIFLATSVWHFSGDPARGTPLWTRVLYGGAIIVLPTVRHAPEVARLFELLIGESLAAHAVAVLSALAWPWLVALLLAVLHRAKSDWLTGVEIASVAVLAVLAPPLVAFTTFFCAMHSPRHILRTVFYSGQRSWRSLVLEAVFPMLAVLAGSAVAWHYLDGVSLEAGVMQIVFVGLAALTVPHMVIVERVRSTGWVPRNLTVSEVVSYDRVNKL